jgi:hypothetical protein
VRSMNAAFILTGICLILGSVDIARALDRG